VKGLNSIEYRIMGQRHGGHSIRVTCCNLAMTVAIASLSFVESTTATAYNESNSIIRTVNDSNSANDRNQ
jgi:hypothetical protein